MEIEIDIFKKSWPVGKRYVRKKVKRHTVHKHAHLLTPSNTNISKCIYTYPIWSDMCRYVYIHDVYIYIYYCMVYVYLCNYTYYKYNTMATNCNRRATLLAAALGLSLPQLGQIRKGEQWENLLGESPRKKPNGIGCSSGIPTHFRFPGLFRNYWLSVIHTNDLLILVLDFSNKYSTS